MQLGTDVGLSHQELQFKSLQADASATLTNLEGTENTFVWASVDIYLREVGTARERMNSIRRVSDLPQIFRDAFSFKLFNAVRIPSCVLGSVNEASCCD